MENNKDLTINNDLTYGRGYVYSLQYHLVWCTKYRKKVLRDGTGGTIYPDTEGQGIAAAQARDHRHRKEGQHEDQFELWSGDQEGGRRPFDHP